MILGNIPAARILTADGMPQPVGPERTINCIAEVPSVWGYNATVNWLVEDLIPEASLTMLSAESGVGKTWFGHALGGSVAHGRTFLGREVQRKRVLYVDGENPVAVVKKRLGILDIQETPNLTIWGNWCSDPAPGPDDDRVTQFARDHKGLIIYDSLVAFNGGDEQDATETRRFMSCFRRLVDMGATVLVLHHSGKADTSKEYRGSSDFKAAVDTAYKLQESSFRAEGKLRLTLSQFKSRFGGDTKISMELEEGRGMVLTGVDTSTIPDTAAAVERIITEYPGSNQSRIVELAMAQNLKKGKVENFLKLRPSQPGGHNARIYYPVLDAPADRIGQRMRPVEGMPTS